MTASTDKSSTTLAVRNASFALIGCVALLLLAGAIAAVGPRSAKKFAAVEPGFLYRSGQIQERIFRKTVLDHGIDVIVNLGIDKPKPDQIEERRVAREFGIRRETYFLNGNGTGPVESYINAVEQIGLAKRASKQILIHCSAGAQRTTGAIAFYQLLVEKKPVDQVVNHLRKFHDWDDNPDLVPYLNQNMREVAQGLKDRGIIDKLPDALPVIEAK